jgi:hypothetical protein
VVRAPAEKRHGSTELVDSGVDHATRGDGHAFSTSLHYFNCWKVSQAVVLSTDPSAVKFCVRHVTVNVVTAPVVVSA